jgi:hypothetical protein
MVGSTVLHVLSGKSACLPTRLVFGLRQFPLPAARFAAGLL